MQAVRPEEVLILIVAVDRAAAYEPDAGAHNADQAVACQVGLHLLAQAVQIQQEEPRARLRHRKELHLQRLEVGGAERIGNGRVATVVGDEPQAGQPAEAAKHERMAAGIDQTLDLRSGIACSKLPRQWRVCGVSHEQGVPDPIVAADVDRHQVARAKHDPRREKIVHLPRQRGCRGAADREIQDSRNAQIFLQGDRVNTPDISVYAGWRIGVRRGLVRQRKVGVAVAEHEQLLILGLGRGLRRMAGNGEGESGGKCGGACPCGQARVTHHEVPLSDRRPHALPVAASPFVALVRPRTIVALPRRRREGEAWRFQMTVARRPPSDVRGNARCMQR